MEDVMGNCRIKLRAYLWSDDGTQVHISTDPSPESQINIPKADLGDESTQGITPVGGEPVVVTDRNGKEWTYTMVDLWGWEWQFERKDLI